MKFLAVLMLSLLPVWAQAVEVSERVAPWTLLDQFDQAYTLDNGKLVAQREYSSAAELREALEQVKP